MVDGTGLEYFIRRFPQRTFDVGIAEEHAVVFAAGLASLGLKPVVAIYSTFLQRAYDQIIHDVCIPGLPVVFAIDRAGIVGEDGSTHNGVFDLVYMRSIPGMVVMAPKDENELQKMLYTALRHNGPICLRYPRGTGPGSKLSDQFEPLAIGQGEVVYESSGNPLITIVALGSTVYFSVEAARLLERDKIPSRVINARFVKPLDKNLILEAADKSKLIVKKEF